jgi:N-acetylglutamate synthase
MYRFSEMSATDYDEVVSLWRATEGIGEAETLDQFQRVLDRNPGLSLVVRHGNHLVAAVLCCHDGRRGYLYHLAVAAKHRQQGIARQMVERCLENLAAAGIPRCSIHLYADNDHGHSFWRKLGWRERTDLKVMAINLPASP